MVGPAVNRSLFLGIVLALAGCQMPDTPQDAARRWDEAIGRCDGVSIRAAMFSSTEQGQIYIATISAMLDAARRFNDAYTARFGSSAKVEATRCDSEPILAKGTLAVDGALAQLSGDSAPGAPRVTFVRAAGGQWRFDIDRSLPQKEIEAVVRVSGAESRALLTAMEKARSGIVSGELETAAEAEAAATQAVLRFDQASR